MTNSLASQLESQLESLKALTTVVADTGDIEAIRKYQPVDATTNPSLLLKASAMDQYQSLVSESVEWAKQQSSDQAQQVIDAGDKLAVAIGAEIVKIIPGRVSTEVDARLSFNTEETIAKAHRLIDLYQQVGVDKDRVLIKIASTWEGIKAAEVLEKEGINCNLTLLFSFVQARACAEVNAFLISPFVGRILDWYKASTGRTEYAASEDPGVVSVTKIYNYYKSHGYKTVVMGASFRNVGEIIELAGCDRLTIGPNFLEELAETAQAVEVKLVDNGVSQSLDQKLTEQQFRWQMNEDAMATEKTAEGIRNFAADQIKLEICLLSML